MLCSINITCPNMTKRTHALVWRWSCRVSRSEARHVSSAAQDPASTVCQAAAQVRWRQRLSEEEEVLREHLSRANLRESRRWEKIGYLAGKTVCACLDTIQDTRYKKLYLTSVYMWIW